MKRNFKSIVSIVCATAIMSGCFAVGVFANRAVQKKKFAEQEAASNVSEETADETYDIFDSYKNNEISKELFNSIYIGKTSTTETGS